MLDHVTRYSTTYLLQYIVPMKHKDDCMHYASKHSAVFTGIWFGEEYFLQIHLYCTFAA